MNKTESKTSCPSDQRKKIDIDHFNLYQSKNKTISPDNEFYNTNSNYIAENGFRIINQSLKEENLIKTSKS